MSDVRIGRLRGGFCVYWTDPETGKRTRHQLDACTRKEAEAEGIRLARQIMTARRPRGNTVAHIWEDYRADLGDKPTAKTMGYTGKAVLEHFGAYTPDQITTKLCKAYAKKRMDSGISQGSVWTELGHLRSALRFAKDARMIAEAPKVWRPEKPQTDKRILNRGEARALIDGAYDPHVRLAIALLLGTAGRLGAVLDLTWDRVNFDAGTINLRLDDAVTRKGRAILPMNGTTRAALSAAYDAALSDYVIEYAGKRVKSIRTGFSAAVRRSKIGHVRIHDLRHTAAVTMLSEGVPIEKVSQILGHSNVSMTFSTYARYCPHHMSDAVDLLDFGALRKASGQS